MILRAASDYYVILPSCVHSYFIMRASPQLSQYMHVRGPVLSPADSHLHAGHSPLRGFQMLVDVALESPTSALSNAVSTSSGKPCSDEGLECKSELESATLMTRPLMHHRRYLGVAASLEACQLLAESCGHAITSVTYHLQSGSGGAWRGTCYGIVDGTWLPVAVREGQALADSARRSASQAVQGAAAIPNGWVNDVVHA